MVELLGVEGLPEIRPGDDLARLVADRIALAPDAVVVLAQKVVSKAENRLVPLDRIRPAPIVREWSHAAGRDPREVQAVLAEARRVVRVAGAVLITETHHGFVCANSGVDRSNSAPGTLCLLPRDPDRSARELAARLGAPVIVSDTWGRPFRLGAVEMAIGIAGVPALLDHRGRRDPAGRTLRTSQTAVADELAAAAGLVMGKLRRIPAVLVRGLPFREPAGTGTALLRDRGEDLFR